MIRPDDVTDAMVDAAFGDLLDGTGNANWGSRPNREIMRGALARAINASGCMPGHHACGNDGQRFWEAGRSMKPSQEQIEAWKESAADPSVDDDSGWSDGEVQTISELAYAAGRKAGMEEAERIIENQETYGDYVDGWFETLIEKIRAALQGAKDD